MLMMLVIWRRWWRVMTSYDIAGGARIRSCGVRWRTVEMIMFTAIIIIIIVSCGGQCGRRMAVAVIRLQHGVSAPRDTPSWRHRRRLPLPVGCDDVVVDDGDGWAVSSLLWQSFVVVVVVCQRLPPLQLTTANNVNVSLSRTRGPNVPKTFFKDLPMSDDLEIPKKVSFQSSRQLSLRFRRNSSFLIYVY